MSELKIPEDLREEYEIAEQEAQNDEAYVHHAKFVKELIERIAKLERQWIPVAEITSLVAVGRDWIGLLTDGRCVFKGRCFVRWNDLETGEIAYGWRSDDTQIIGRIDDGAITAGQPMPSPPEQ